MDVLSFEGLNQFEILDLIDTINKEFEKTSEEIRNQLSSKYYDLLKLKDLIITAKDYIITNKDNQMITLLKEKESLIDEKESIIKGQLEVIQNLIKSHEKIAPHRFADFRPAYNNNNNIDLEFRDENSEIKPIPLEIPREPFVIQKFDEYNYRISGKTYDYKEIIKSAGNVQWNKETKSWIFPNEQLFELRKILENNLLPYNII